MRGHGRVVNTQALRISRVLFCIWRKTGWNFPVTHGDHDHLTLILSDLFHEGIRQEIFWGPGTFAIVAGIARCCIVASTRQPMYLESNAFPSRAEKWGCQQVYSLLSVVKHL
jgi:hypothetical protein